MQDGGLEVESLNNRPRLSRWVTEYWDAFQLLSGSRIVHQGGIGPIPLTEIVAYMDAVYLIDVDERLRTIKMIQSLDRVYVTHVNGNAAQRAKQAKVQSGVRHTRKS